MLPFALVAALNSAEGAVAGGLLMLGLAGFALMAGLGAGRLSGHTLPLDISLVLGIILLLPLLAAPVLLLGWHPLLGVALLLPLAALGAPHTLQPQPAGLALVLLAVLSFTLAWTLEGSLRVVSFAQTGMLHAWPDVLLHAITVAEQGDARTLPRLNAVLVDVPPPFYHFASFALPALFVRLLDITPLAAVTGIWLPIGIGLLALSVCALGRELAGVPGAALAMLLLATLPEGALYGLRNGFLSFHWLLDTAPGTGYGCAAGLVALALLARHVREGGMGLLLLSAVALAVSILLRVQMFVWLAPAWAGGVVLASPLVPKLARLPLLLAGAVLGLIGAWWMVRPDIARDGLPVVLERYFLLLRSVEEGTPYRALADWMAAHLPLAPRLTVTALLVLIAPSPALAAALAVLGGIAFRRGRLRPLDAVPTLLLAWVVVVMLLGPNPPHGDVSEWRHRGFPLVVLVQIAWVSRLLLAVCPNIAQARALAVLACLGTIATWQYAGLWKRPVPPWAVEFRQREVPLPLHAAARWLRREARGGESFAVALPEPGALLTERSVDLMAMSGVPVHVARARYYATLSPRFAGIATARLAFLDHILGLPREEALAMLHAARIGFYVVLDGAGPAWAQEGHAPAFEAPGIAIFRTGAAP